MTAEFQSEPVNRALYVLLDQSAKMNEAPSDAGGTWWQLASRSIEDFVGNSTLAVSQFGIQYFPLGSAPASCQPIYGTPDVELSTQLGATQPIFVSLLAHAPQGLAATGPALQGALSYLKGHGPSVGLRSAVLITAGPPGACQPSTIADLAGLASGALQSDPQVFTYVIALGEAASLFDPVAAAGGTTHAYAITGSNVPVDFNDAFADIVGFHVPCTFDARQLAPAGSTLDPSLLSVAFLPATSQSEITRFRNAADCANNEPAQGWYFNDATGQIVLCPNICDPHPLENVRFEYGCQPPPFTGDAGQARCGDGVCEPIVENTFSCPIDCAGFCGDGVCSHSEDQFSCPNDCGGTCGDGVCGRNEDAFSCSPDCFCSNHTCDTDETAQSCPVDCACGAAEKFCNGTCVLRKPANGCNSLTCDPCTTVPSPNGVATCDQNGACGFSCLSGFRKSGDRCVSIFGDAAAD